MIKIKTYFKNKLLTNKFKNNDIFKFVPQALSLIKEYSLNIPDSTDAYDDIKIALDDVVEMEVGDDLGMVAHLLPHTYARTNPFKLTTSDRNIVDIDGMVMTAKKTGTVEITATTLDNNYSDSITVNVVEPHEFIATADETYTIEPERFNLVDGDMSQEQAWINSNAIKAIIQYAKEKGYKKVVFPKGKTFYYDPSNSIYIRNNLIMDLNGSTIQAYPNYLYTYNGVYTHDNIRGVNICPRGWEGLTDSGYASYITDYSPNENGVMTYWKNEITSDYVYDLNLTTGGELGEYYVNGTIPIVASHSLDEYNQYKNFIIKDKQYIGYFKYTKYRHYDKTDTSVYTYTYNNVKLEMECYKNNELVATKELINSYWNNIKYAGRDLEFKFTIGADEDYDYVKLKASGLSDPNYPLNALLYDVKIYEYRTVDSNAENIILENGRLLGDRYITDANDEYIKEKLFNEKYGKNWSAIQKTEGTQNIDISYGYNIGCRNMVIGDSIGFNIAIGNGKQLNCYYPNANLFEYGAFDDNGNKIDKDNYARFSTPISVNIDASPYFIITDPTFSTIYYYGFTSRLIDVYCYDENMNFLKALKGKFRHGLLKAPEGTKYINLSVPLAGQTLPIKGNSDFSNCITAIKFMYPTKKCFIKNCEIRNNYSCGIAHSGMGVLIEGCRFYNNMGRMPWCDIDSEDGWVRMQNNIFRNNTFESYHGVIMCSGTNYVFKNNTFNCPYTQYSDCQYFKLIGNTFLNQGYIGTSNMGTMADEYIVKNTFNDVPIAASKNHSGSNYKAYFFYNNIINSRVGLSSPDTICGSNNLIGEITLNSYNENIINISDKTNSLVMSNSYEFSNIDFKEIKILVRKDKNLTFNNCIFKVLPKNYSSETMGTITFNNCTIYNAVENTKYVYNNCTFINGIIDKYILDGIDRDKLVFTQTEASGIYYGMQDTNIKKAKDWTICALIKKNINFNCMLLLCDACEMYPAAGKNSVNTYIYYTNDGGATKESWKWNTVAPEDLVGDSDYFTSTITYDSTAKKYAIYINNGLVRDRAIPDGYEPYPITNPIKIEQSQCTILYYYAYDKCMNEEERANVHNILSSQIKHVMVNGNIELNEGESGILEVSLNNPIKETQTLTVSTSKDYNVEKNCNTLTFTPDNYNIPQRIELRANYDELSTSDKTTTLTFTPNSISETIEKKEVILTSTNNTIESSTLEQEIKAQYPDKCITFKGSFDFASLTSTFFNNCSVGDFWINDKTTTNRIYHGRIHEPNDILYYDGTNVQPLRRNKFTNISVEAEYDVCIVGGGAGGVATAYALKDKGYKVCMVEKLSELGGTHIHASIPVLISTPITGTWFKDIVKDAYDIGVVEINQWSGRKDGVGDGTLFDKLWRSSLYCDHCNERGVQWNVSMGWFSNRYYQDLHNSIDIKLRTEFIESVIENEKITQIKVKSLDTNTEYYIKSKFFVDCSADGVLCRSNKTLNVDYFIGTDGRERFGEQSYDENSVPDIYDINTIEAGYQVVDGSEGFPGDKSNAVSLWDELPNPDDYPDISKKVNGMTYDPQFRFIRTISPSGGCPIDPHIFIDQGNDAALEAGFKRSLVHWQLYASNTGYLTQNKMLGIRESYRIKCDRMLTQTDCEKLITEDDLQPEHIIALSTWYADLHNAVVSVKNSGFNGIPYESLIPCAFNNVLVASRCYGCSHLAQSSFRLTKTMMSLGYAAGNALSQCVDNSLTNVRDININKLQNDIDIFNLYNEVAEHILT